MEKPAVASVLSFEDKIYISPEDLPSFSQSCKEIYDASSCDLEPCIVKCFCDKLFSFTKEKNTPLSEKAFLLDICKKWSTSFDEMFAAVKYNKFCLDYF